VKIAAFAGVISATVAIAVTATTYFYLSVDALADAMANAVGMMI
jgi:hypothetical protein